MVKVVANTVMRGDEKGAEVTMDLQGDGLQITDEVLAIIQGLMNGLKDNDILLHALCLQRIADNPRILLGKGDDDEEEELREAMAVKMSKTTDKSVIC